jgi:hypothetical protein
MSADFYMGMAPPFEESNDKKNFKKPARPQELRLFGKLRSDQVWGENNSTSQLKPG